MILTQDTYKTIKKAVGDALYKEKGSKFIGYAYPVTTEDEIKVHLDELKKITIQQGIGVMHGK